MPRRKQSRMPTRARPVPSQEPNMPVDIETDQAKEKLRLLLEDFDHEVERRVKMMEDEIESILQSIRKMYQRDLMHYPADVLNKPWQQSDAKEEEKRSMAMRNSMACVLSAAETVLQTATARRLGHRAKQMLHPAENNGPAPSPPVTRSMLRTRQRKVLGISRTNNMLPPPSTARVQCSRKAVQEAAATPANQGIPASCTSSLVITPKFNPYTPLPLGTIKRHPKVGEIAISLRGSPLQVAPVTNPKIGMEGWVESLDVENMDEETKAELLAIHEKVNKMLNTCM